MEAASPMGGLLHPVKKLSFRCPQGGPPGGGPGPSPRGASRGAPGAPRGPPGAPPGAGGPPGARGGGHGEQRKNIFLPKLIFFGGSRPF